MASRIFFINWAMIRFGCNNILRKCGLLRCQNVVHEPLEAFESETGAEVKSPHGSPESIGDIRFVVCAPAFELVDKDGFSGIDGAGSDRLRSPSRSMLDEISFALVAAIELPKKCLRLIMKPYNKIVYTVSES